MKAFEKFIRSRNGMLSLFGGLIILLLIVAYFSGAFGGITGTAGIPSYPTYPMPPTEGNYTCLPTCDPTDSKMFILAGANQFSMSNTPIKVWIMVPGDQATFKLGIFDGDTSKDANNTLLFFASGDFNPGKGNWDDATDTDTTYTLYADPLADGSGQTSLASWIGNEVMLNNAWWETTIDRNDQAKAPNGHYYYRLEATRPMEGKGGQAFKVRATGYVFTGQHPEWVVGLIGGMTTNSDLKIVYPQSSGTTKLGTQMTYNGDWQMYFYIPKNAQNFEIWNGDFDRGTLADTDDPNTEGKPTWATSAAVDEGVGGLKHDGVGNPNDDNSKANYFRVSPAVTYEVLDPKGEPVYTDDNPSGTEEWEKFNVDSNPNDAPDVISSGTVTPGMYNIHIKGMDLHNAFWLGVSYPICDPIGGCPPDVWVEASCPRTIGYWKNNVKKIYIQKKTNGIQESKASLDWGLRNVALASKLYRSGINVQNPVAIETATPLTPTEANAIMQKTNGNSMLDRALQQNLATWMNLATGKIGANSQIEIKGIAGGDFSGTMMEALRFSEDVMLDPAKRADAGLLERAKDIADMINNNAITTDATENNENLACTAYETGVVPKDKQPPKHEKMPKAPKPEAPENQPAPEPVCTAGNNYNIENTTNNPFYSVKFEFTSGNEVKEGGFDTFKYTLPTDVVAAMESMQVEVKASTDSRIYDLTCDFTNPLGCGDPVGDEAYSVSFDGATDNGDGTSTLSFTVSVFGQHGLSHVSFSLPEGQTAGGVEGNYTTEACVAP